MMVCTPDTEVKPCYGGFAETEGKGTCKGGQQTCNDDGSGFGECVGEVLPTMSDDCAKSTDTTCDGKLTCPCQPKKTKPCYDGMPATTAGVGICKSGIRTCNDDGTGFGDCIGEIKPSAENCATPEDENCDGAVNEATSGCVCDPTMMAPSDCTTTQLGVCAGGTHVCAADGKSYSECISKLMPSFEDCFTTDDEDCDGKPALACAGTSIIASAPGTSSGDDSLFGVASDAAGNIFLGGVSGSSQGTNYTVAAGAAEITKLDKNGMQTWKKSYPSTGVGSYSVIRGVTVDGTGNVLLVGEYWGTINSNGVSLTSTVGSPDVFVIKLAPDGTLKWSKSFGGAGDQFGTSISAAVNGNVFITGSMSGTMVLGSTTLSGTGSTDIFVAKLDAATGDPLWSKNFGDASAQVGWGIAATPDGNVAVTGQSAGGIDFGGGSLGNKGKNDIFLAKLDGNTGLQVWAKRFGDSADQVGFGVAADSKGNIVLTGYVQGKTDFGAGDVDVGVGNPSELFVASFAPDGTHRWSHVFGDSTNPQQGRAVAVDGAGNVLVAGYFNGIIQFGTTTLTNPSGSGGTPDVFVAKLKGSDGTPGWARTFGFMSDQVAWTVAADPLGNVILGGTFKGMINFAPPAGLSFTSMNNTYDAFWAKLAP